MTVPDPERLSQIDRDLEALGKAPEELAALRARLPRGSDLQEIDAALADLANGTNGTAVRIAMAPAAPSAPRPAAASVPRPAPRQIEGTGQTGEGRNTEELIDVESLRVDGPTPAKAKGAPPPPAPAKPSIPARRIPTAPPSKKSVAPAPAPAPLPARPPAAGAPPKPSLPAHPPPPSVQTALRDEESIEDVRDDELDEGPAGKAAAAAAAAAPGRGLSVDDLFGDHALDDGPFADLSGSFSGAGDAGASDLLSGDGPRAGEGLGNLSDELESDMTAVYTGEEMRALGSIPPPSSAADLDAELDAFTSGPAPAPRASVRPLSVADFGADPFADNAAPAAPAAEGGDFELLIDDDALAS